MNTLEDMAACVADLKELRKRYRVLPHSHGPHIANVRMMNPKEAKEFDDSLKPGNTPKP